MIDVKKREPAPGVFRLVLPLPFPGLDEVNAYLLTSDEGATLVDCGIWFPEAREDEHGWTLLVEALEVCGVAPSDVKRLVLTHSHIDHYGMAGRLKEETGCEILMQKEGDSELDVLRDPDRYRRELRQTYADHGVHDESELEELTKFEDWRGFVHSVVEADVWLEGDESLKVGDRTWDFVYTPGHARSHICLFSADEKLLISGDHLLGSITPHIDFRRGDHDPLGDFLTSLETVEKLEPAVVLPGHGRPFSDGAESARGTARHHERRLGAILQVVRKQACNADHITNEIFGATLLNFQKRLALGEALAHIHYLRLKGEIERFQNDEGDWMYKKASRRAVQEVEE